jgi:hypothetical protein
MLGGMRYAIALLVFITLACSKQESPTEGATETVGETESSAGPDSAAKAARDEAQEPALGPPTVTLVTAGKLPLRKIRWQFQEGAKEVLNTTINQVFEMKGSGVDTQSAPAGIKQTIEFTTKGVSATGTADVEVLIREVEELGTSESDSPAIIGGKGATGTYKVDSTGAIQSLELEAAPDAKYKTLDVIKNLLRRTLFPFPKEPIGAGAKWTVTQALDQFGTPANEVTNAELLELDESELVVRLEIKGTGSRPGAPGQTVTLEMDTQILARLSPSKLVPLSSELESQTVETVKAAGVDGEMGELTVRTNRTVKMQGK